MFIVDNRRPKITQAKPGDVIEILPDSGQSGIPGFYLVCSINPEPDGTWRVDNVLRAAEILGTEQVLFLVSCTNGEAFCMPPPGTRVAIMDRASVYL